MLNFLAVISLCAVLVSGETGGNSTVEYDPGDLLEKIFNPNHTILPRQYGLVSFEAASDQNQQSYGLYNGPISSGNPLKFEDQDLGNQGHITFQDDNGVDQNHQKKRRKKRRRRPKFQPQGFPGPNYPYQGAGYPGQVGQPQYFNQIRPGQYYRPTPKPSLASGALSSVIGALTSIAQYDDYQCVPRLLCEAAGGAAPGSTVLNSVGALQPLITLLAAYSGASASPLFVFGRAVLLGMTSKDNPGSCRYAYPQCPTDTEQLVHYLNNHNGGFFRFFNGQPEPYPQQGPYPQQYPQLPNPQNPYNPYPQNPYPGNLYPQNPQLQNVNQFYNQLSQSYGFYNPSSNEGPVQSGYPGHGVPQGIHREPNYYQQGNGYLQAGNGQNYGSNYPYNGKYGYYKGSYKTSRHLKELNVSKKIEKRIQNKPSDNEDNNFDAELSSKWTFPETSKSNSYIKVSPNRPAKGLRFPQESDDLNTNGNIEHNTDFPGFSFPESQSNRYYLQNYIPRPTPISPDHSFNYYTNNRYVSNNYYKDKEDYDNDDRTQTIYIVRENGDPNNPEIVKLKPGQQL